MADQVLKDPQGRTIGKIVTASSGVRTPTERLSRSAVESDRNGVEFALNVPADVCTFRKVLAQQSICILVRATLPRASWITEVDFQAGVDAKLSMLGQLRTLVPSQRLAQLCR